MRPSFLAFRHTKKSIFAAIKRSFKKKKYLEIRHVQPHLTVKKRVRHYAEITYRALHRWPFGTRMPTGSSSVNFCKGVVDEETEEKQRRRKRSIVFTCKDSSGQRAQLSLKQKLDEMSI